MKKPTAPASTVQELDEDDLDKIVGGVATAANLKHMDDLIQTDLIGHTTGHSETAAIAGMIAKGAVSAQDAIHAIETGAAQDAIHAIETGAARDGKHSADQQLVNLQTALNQIHATPAASAFAAEETKRIGAGTTTADLTRLVSQGAMTEQAAGAVLLSEAHASNGAANVGAMMLDLDTRTGGNSVVETALGQLVKSGALSATTAMSVVEAEARGLDHSVDVALANLEIGSGANTTISTEIDNRLGFALNFDYVQPGQNYEGAIATAYDTVAISTTKTTSALADFIQSGQITVATAVATLETEAKVANISPVVAIAALVQATGGNAQVESYLPPLLAKGLMNGSAQADVAMAVYLGNLSPQQAVNAILSAAKIAQSSGGKDGLALPGAAEGQVALAKLGAAVGLLTNGSSSYDATDPLAATLGTYYITYAREANAGVCQTMLAGTYGTAINRGNAIVSMVADLGAPLAVSVLNYAAGGTAQANSGLPQLLAKGVMDGSAQAEIVTATSLGLLTPQQAISVTMAAATLAQHSGGKDGLVLPGAAEVQVALANLDTAAEGHQGGLRGTLDGTYGPAVANGHNILSMITRLGPTLAVSVLTYAEGGAAQANSDLPQLLAKGLINGTAGIDIATAAALGQLTPQQAIDVTKAAVRLAEHSGGKDGLVLPGEAETQVALANLDAAAQRHGAADLHNMLVASYGPTIARGGAIVSMLNELGPTLSVSVLNYVAGGAAQTKSGLTQLLAKGLIDGTSEDDIGRVAALGLLTPQQAINLCSAAVSLAQHSGGKDGLVLPGPAEAEVVLAKLDAAALQFQASALHDALTKTYGIAIAAGNAFIPMIADLGPTVTVKALTVGLGLAATAGPTTGTEATLIVGLEAAAKAAGVSVDEALTMASLYAVGHSQVLKVEMTERILGGAAAADLAALAATGKISATTAATILINEVGSLAASSPNNSALGFDRATATGLALARLDLAAVALQGNAKLPASELAGAQNLQTAIEGEYTRAILVGLGAIIGLVEGGGAGAQSLNNAAAAGVGAVVGQAVNDLAAVISGSVSIVQAKGLDPASAALVNAAQALINHLLPTALGVNLAANATGGSVTQDDVTSSVDDDVTALTNAYSSAYQLASFEKEWTSSDPATEGAVPKDISASLQTYNFTEVGVNVDVSASTTIPFGNGFSLALSAHAGAGASASVNATQVTVAAAASASAQAEIDLGGHAKIVMLTQAIASGAVSVGVTGVTIQANVAVGASVSISQTEQGSLGNGFDGMESTTLTVGTVAGANAGGSIGLKNQLSFGAQVGVYASAGVTGDFSFGGVTVGGGATILSPGIVGVSADVGVDFSGGNITINLNAFIGVELFGVAFNLNLTIPTGAIVNALATLGSEIGSGVVQAAEGFASTFQSLGGSFDSLGNSLESSFENLGDDITSLY